MSVRTGFGGGIALVVALCQIGSAQSFQLIKSLSGPSGKTVGAKFVFDETRSRFVYPQDKSLIVYFEWKAPLGMHTLSAVWKGPDGRTLSISPDIKIEAQTAELNAYWTFLITPNEPSGIWTCEVRIDGEPAGSHSFEMVIPEAPAQAEKPKEPERPTMDELYNRVTPSLVWVHALDADGTRLDSSSGFVYGKNLVATSFEAIDSANLIEIEFADGRRARTDEVVACSRLQDWAILRADTASVTSLSRGDSAAVQVGQRLPVFDAHSNHIREFGGVDVTGKQSVKNRGPRILFSPAMNVEASGGPLLDLEGRVIGILGASLTPGARFHQKNITMMPALWNDLTSLSAATPVSILPANLPDQATTFRELMEKHVFTRPLSPGPSFLWGGTSDQVSKNAADAQPRYVSEFRPKQDVWVQMMWQKREKNGKGVLAAQIFDAANQMIGAVPPKKLSLNGQSPTRVAFSFPASPLAPGTYRIDVLWNDLAVWRTFFTVVE
jgi:hypothetical protein